MEIINFKELQENFNSALENTKHRRFLIKKEIEELIRFIDTIESNQENNPFKSFKYRNIPRSIHIPYGIFKLKIKNSIQLNKTFYELIYLGDNSLEEETKTNEEREFNLKITQQARDLFEYYIWLYEILEFQEKPSKKDGLTLNQKILALDYLGVDLATIEKTKIAKVLSLVLGMNEQNIRSCLTYINIAKNEVRTKNNLNTLSLVFENQEFKDISMKIQKDIDSL
jgi:hypothetical protein